VFRSDRAGEVLMKQTIMLVAFLLTGCLEQGSSGTSSGVAVSATLVIWDSWATAAYGGNWPIASSPTYIAYFDLGLEYLSISGTSYTFVRHGASCTSTETGTIFFADPGTSTTYTISNRNVINAPHGSCTIAYDLTAGQTGHFTPSSWVHTIPEGALTGYTGEYFITATRLGLENADTANGLYNYYVFRKR